MPIFSQRCVKGKDIAALAYAECRKPGVGALTAETLTIIIAIANALEICFHIASSLFLLLSRKAHLVSR